MLIFFVYRIPAEALIPVRISKTTNHFYILSLAIASPCLDMADDLISEVLSTERALRLHLHPVNSALLMKVMLHVARHHYDLTVTLEFEKTNDAVCHVEIFVLVICVSGTLQLLEEFPQSEVFRLLRDQIDLILDLL